MQNDLAMKLPLIRKVMPSLIASDIAGVQPLQENTFKHVMSINYDSTPWLTRLENTPDGTLIHEFAKGYSRVYGTELIDLDLYWKIKIAGL